MSWLSIVASNILLASLIAAAAWIVQRRLERPAAARLLWALALVKLVTPPLVGVPLVELPASAACAVGACACGAEHATLLAIAGRAGPGVLMGLWGVGAAITLAAAGRRWVQFRRLAAHARPAPRTWQALAQRLAGELSLRRAPLVLMTPGRLPPLVVAGWGGPRVLLPEELARGLRGSQRRRCCSTSSCTFIGGII